MAFTFKSFADIYTDITTVLTNSGTALTDLNTGSMLQALVRSATAALSLGWIGLSQLRDLFYINSSFGTDLDLRVGDFAMIRNPGAFATGSILVYPLTGGQTVSVGDRVTSLDGSVIFETLNSASITSSPTVISVVAIGIGSNYNLLAGTNLTSTNTNLQVVVGSALDINSAPTGSLTSGVDAETDNQVKARFADYLKSLSRGTKLAILQALRGTPAIGNVILEEATPVPGWITVTVADAVGNLPNNTRDAVIQVLTDWGVAGMGYIIKPVTRTTYVTSVTVYATQDLAIPKATIESAISASLTTGLGSVTLGQSVYTSFINKLAFLDNFNISRVIVNSPEAPGVMALPGELLAPESISVSVVYVV